MLTGDAQEVADTVAGMLGVDEAYGGLLPAGKVEKVEALLESQTRGKRLVFVGDGINDAPVLSRADIGIAMGGLGSDAAIEAADVVLMDDKPSKIATAIRISRKTLRIVYQNILFALGVKGLVLLMGTLGVATMWEAVFADVGVAVLAILNAMRALRIIEAREGFGKARGRIAGVGGLARGDAHRHNRLIRDDRQTVGGQVVGVTQGFDAFQCPKHTGRAECDQWAVNFPPISDLSNDRAAALGHAVHFVGLDRKAGDHGRAGHDRAG